MLKFLEREYMTNIQKNNFSHIKKNKANYLFNCMYINFIK